MKPLLPLGLQWQARLQRQWRRAWTQDAAWVRWGLPAGMVGLGLVAGSLVLGSTGSLADQQAQLLDLRQRNVEQQRLWASQAPWREQAATVKSSVLAWQLGLRWQQDTPWLLWSDQAKAWGVTLQRIQAVSVQTTAHHVQHRISLEGTGRLSEVEAFWRALGRQGWWVSLVSMRMDASAPAGVTWQAQWALHEVLPADAPRAPVEAHQAGSQAQWVKQWLAEGGPSIAAAHAAVPPAPTAKPSDGVPVASEAAVWPRTDWRQMRWVGRWMRGQQVVALVAVDGVVHVVVPGMRLGPQLQPVVQVTPEGVWVAAGDGRHQRVLRWSKPGLEENS